MRRKKKAQSACNNLTQLTELICACEGASEESRAMPAYEKPPALPGDQYSVY